MLKVIEHIISRRAPTPSSPPIKYELSHSAAISNSSIWSRFGFDMSQFIASQKGTHIFYGSELRDPKVLESLLHHHKSLPNIKSILSKGIAYPVSKLKEETRIDMLKAALKKGSHHSVKKPENAPALRNRVKSDIENGLAIPITQGTAMKIVNGECYSLGVTKLFSIHEHGDRIPKKGVTHDLSFPRNSNLAINQRVRKDELLNCICGFSLLQVPHYIHHLRSQFPNNNILLLKADLS